MDLSRYMSIYLSIYLSVCLSVCLSIYLSIYVDHRITETIFLVEYIATRTASLSPPLSYLYLSSIASQSVLYIYLSSLWGSSRNRGCFKISVLALEERAMCMRLIPARIGASLGAARVARRTVCEVRGEERRRNGHT